MHFDELYFDKVSGYRVKYIKVKKVLLDLSIDGLFIMLIPGQHSKEVTALQQAPRHATIIVYTG